MSGQKIKGIRFFMEKIIGSVSYRRASEIPLEPAMS